jgi:hypothetical protein
MLRCAQSPRSNVLVEYASARRFFARLASEIFLSSLQQNFSASCDAAVEKFKIRGLKSWANQDLER